MSRDDAFISFPPGYLGSRPVKFPLLVDTERLFAVSKPSGMACYQHEWSLGKPDLSMALRREILGEKPQLARLGIQGLFRIYNLDAEISGVLLYAKTEEAETLLKNAAGSGQLSFKYHLLVSQAPADRSLLCDLPIAKHFHEKRMLVSHKTGKKCATRFQYLRSYGQYELWEAESTELRVHQTRLHAAESGLKIVGETLYSDGGQIHLSRLKRDFKRSDDREAPIYPHLCLHLVELGIRLPDFETDSVCAPLPNRFETLLKRLDTYRGRRG